MSIVSGSALEKITLSVAAKNLVLKGVFSNSAPTPFAVLNHMNENRMLLDRIGITEAIKDQANPNWISSYTLDYNFERNELINIQAYSRSSSSHPLTDLLKHNHIGSVSFSISTLMHAPSQTLTLPIGDTADKSAIIVRAEIQANTRDNFVATFSANNMSNKEGFFSKSDPFIEISRLNEDNSWTVVWKNDHIDNTLNPRWATAKISMVTLCNGDIERPLRFTFWDWEKNGKHKFMGKSETNLRTLLTSNGAPIDIIEPEKQSKNKYKNSGTFMASNCTIEHNPTFSEFIAGGCQLSMMVAIDFTGSNGDPRLPTSLHYIDPSGNMNQYETVIQSVGSVLEHYDSDNMYPVYGFGARVRLPDNTHTPAQHCFPIYGGGVEVPGVSGILQAYKAAVPNVMFSGPTLFAPLINTAAQFATSKRCDQEEQNYSILLIITDGVINDLEQTKAAIISASLTPLSIIIVGVGSADYTEMNALDSDDKLLTANGKTAVRDIVQFVPYRDVATHGTFAVAQEVLAEIPTQFLEYMRQNRISPKPRLTAQQEVSAV